MIKVREKAAYGFDNQIRHRFARGGFRMMHSAIARHDPGVLQRVVRSSLKTNRRMGWSDFVLYQLSYILCLATLVGRIRTCDSDVIQTGSRFVYSLKSRTEFLCLLIFKSREFRERILFDR